MPLKSEDFKRQSQKVKNKVAYLSRSPDITEKICASSLLMLMPKFLERYDETQNKNKYKMLKWNGKKKKKDSLHDSATGSYKNKLWMSSAIH